MPALNVLGGVGLGAMALGGPLERFSLTVVLRVAALPSASNVALPAERFGAANEPIARNVNGADVFQFFRRRGRCTFKPGLF